MPVKTNTKGFALAFLLASAYTSSAFAELKPVSDSELSEVVGQAYISIDKTYNPDQKDLSYTRINLGMDIDTKLNADKMDLGHYDRAGEAPGSSDILINNFGLGYINNAKFFNEHSYIPQMKKPDGSSYAEGEIVPFHIKDPYLEFAHDEKTGQLLGVRIGFGQAEGLMTGDIKSLTGNVDVAIRDKASGLTAVSSQQSGGNIFEQVLVALTPYLVNGDVSTQAALVDQHGNPDAIRSNTIGMVNGSNFTVTNVDGAATLLIKTLDAFGALSSTLNFQQTSAFGCGLLGLFSCNTMKAESQDCRMLGVQTCFPLDSFQTLPVGKIEKVNGKPQITGSASGMFLSFQTKDVPWSTTAKASDAQSSADFMTATQGAFFNVPTGAVEVNLSEVYKGTPMVRQEFIDRGRGLF